MKTIYLAFLGKKDPFCHNHIAIPGPNISFLTDRKYFDHRCVFLVHNDVAKNAEAMESLCANIVDTNQLSFPIFDCCPVDICELFKVVQTEIQNILSDYGHDVMIHVNTSPGTPQMQFCLLLAATYTPQMKLYQVVAPQFKSDKHIVEINLSQVMVNAMEVNREIEMVKKSANYDLNWIDELEAQVSKICPESRNLIAEARIGSQNAGIDLPLILQNIEKNILIQVIKQFPNLAEAARFVGMKPNSFRKKIHEQWKLKNRKKNGFSK